MPSSITFNGSSQYSQVGAGIIDPTVGYTIEAYVKLNAEITTGEYEFVHLENNTQKWIIRMRYQYNAGTLRIYFYTARWVLIGFQAVHNISLGSSTWVHLAMARSSTFIKAYVDGVNVGTDATITDNLDGTTTTNTQLVVGAGTTEGTTTHINYANTKMACLRIWSDVRTDAEILANKDTVITGTADNLVGSWYNGDEDHNDDSQSNNLTAVGSPTFDSADFPFVIESPSPSLSPSASPSNSPSSSPSSSISASISSSPSASPSPSSSISLSPSSSPSSSQSPSSSVSLSPSSSPSLSPSPSSSQSASPSSSPSASPSPSSSISPSPSSSISLSPSPSSSVSSSPSSSISLSPSPSSSISLSPSSSPSSSQSPSSSESPSISLSPSSSFSSSISPSPSIGYTDYSRGNYAVLPTNDDDLETLYTAQDLIDVATADNIRVGQDATNEFMIHEYKNFVGDQANCQLNWEGQTTLAPATSTVYLQIYNRNTTTWDTVDSDSTSSVNTDFVLVANIPDLTNYRDALNLISSRIYQEAI